MQSLTVRTFHGAAPGRRFLTLGAIHGNEKCGTEAISRLMTELDSGIVTLAAGTLVCAPICNPEAYARDLRYVEQNLNRIIAPHAAPACAEQRRANEVVALIDQCDILLDLHSYSAGVKPFLFLDKEDASHRAYAAALGITDWVAGWNDAYASATGDLNNGDTVSYAHSKGKIATLVECGIHTDPAGGGVGYRALRAALAHFGMTAPYPLAGASPTISRLTSIVAKDREGDFTRDWQHLDPVKAGDVIARYTDGEEVRAPHDGVVILPGRTAALGAEWVYFGTNE